MSRTNSCLYLVSSEHSVEYWNTLTILESWRLTIINYNYHESFTLYKFLNNEIYNLPKVICYSDIIWLHGVERDFLVYRMLKNLIFVSCRFDLKGSKNKSEWLTVHLIYWKKKFRESTCYDFHYFHFNIMKYWSSRFSFRIISTDNEKAMKCYLQISVNELSKPYNRGRQLYADLN